MRRSVSFSLPSTGSEDFQIDRYDLDGCYRWADAPYSIVLAFIPGLSECEVTPERVLLDKHSKMAPTADV